MAEQGTNGTGAPSAPAEKPTNVTELFDEKRLTRRIRKSGQSENQNGSATESRFPGWLVITAYVLIALTALYTIWGLLGSLSR